MANGEVAALYLAADNAADIIIVGEGNNTIEGGGLPLCAVI